MQYVPASLTAGKWGLILLTEEIELWHLTWNLLITTRATGLLLHADRFKLFFVHYYTRQVDNHAP